MIPTALGVGIIHLPGIEPLLASGTDLVQVLEIEPQTVWVETGDPYAPYRPDLETVVRLQALPQAKLIHGVGFPVGGSRAPDSRQLAPFLTMIEAFQPQWASEHLSFNRAAGPEGEFKTGFLLPPRQTAGGVAAAVSTIKHFAAQLPVPFAVETGVNYLRPRLDEVPDGAFVGAVASMADCGILLDLHNIWANQRNGRQSVEEYLDQLPLHRVWEIHLAGGSEYLGFWLDAHAGPIPEDLYALAERVLPRLPNLSALIFELAPTDLAHLGLDGVAAEMERLHALWPLRGRTAEAEEVDERAQLPIRPTTYADCLPPARWEDILGSLVVGRPSEQAVGSALAQDPGVELLQTLVCEFRAGMVVEALQLTARLLLLSVGEDGIRALFRDFWRVTPPELFKATEGEAFASYLVARDLDIPYLADVLAFERAVLRALIHGEDQVVPFSYDPVPVLRAVAEGRYPSRPMSGRYEMVVTAESGAELGVSGVMFGSALG